MNMNNNTMPNNDMNNTYMNNMSHNMMPQMTNSSPTPESVSNTYFTAGFLRTQIGKLMRVEFLLGTNTVNDRVGRLRNVGASYIVLESIDRSSSVMCDIYSIKFVTIMGDENTTNREMLSLYEH